jgi:hypothetical protein
MVFWFAPVILQALNTQGSPETFSRRHDSSIGFRARVRSNMRTGGVINAEITSSLLESVSKNKKMILFSMLCWPLAPFQIV